MALVCQTVNLSITYSVLLDKLKKDEFRVIQYNDCGVGTI